MWEVKVEIVETQVQVLQCFRCYQVLAEMPAELVQVQHGAGGSDASSEQIAQEMDGYATGGIVNRTGFKFGTKFGRFWKIARKVWDDINPTGDQKYDAQLVADELAEEIFKTSMDDLPQKFKLIYMH
jgi:hypothetical protein